MDRAVRANQQYARTHRPGLAVRPRRALAIVTCMDSRLPVFPALGLDLGEAHVIRNAGGVVTDDVVRSLTISQRLLGTEQIALIHHSDCGLLKITDEGFAERLEAETGQVPGWSAMAFGDLDESVREGMARLRRDPFLARTDRIRGFVFDVDSGLLREVHAPRSD